MKYKLYTHSGYYTFALLLLSGFIQAQPNTLPNSRPNNRDGVMLFEDTKSDTSVFTGLHVFVGGDFTTQFQGLDQTNTGDTLVELGTDFNLPTANLNLSASLLDGVTINTRTYLSSKHHEEAWVKGGHIQIDKLDFIHPGFMKGLMDVTTIRFGLDEFNYGDAHYRRSDNANVIFNPFIENYIMDAFTTEVFGEVTFQKNIFLAVLGLTNGKLNQSVVVDDSTDNTPSFYGKIGFDTRDNQDLRLRLTGSWYINHGLSNGHTLYGGDRSGSRYHGILETLSGESTDFEGRLNPAFKQLTAIQINPMISFKGLELFGVYEIAANSEEEGDGSFTQIAVDLLYRFGGQDQFYFGGRYNTVSGEFTADAPTQEINKIAIGGGWFLSKNILMKLEYVKQEYEGDGWAGTKFAGAEFHGISLEAGISF